MRIGPEPNHGRLRSFIASVQDPNHAHRVANCLGKGTLAAYRCVRNEVAPLALDRVLDVDILRIREMIEDGTLVSIVNTVLSGELKAVDSFSNSVAPSQIMSPNLIPLANAQPR